MIEMQRLKE